MAHHLRHSNFAAVSRGPRLQPLPPRHQSSSSSNADAASDHVQRGPRLTPPRVGLGPRAVSTPLDRYHEGIVASTAAAVRREPRLHPPPWVVTFSPPDYQEAINIISAAGPRGAAAVIRRRPPDPQPRPRGDRGPLGHPVVLPPENVGRPHQEIRRRTWPPGETERGGNNYLEYYWDWAQQEDRTMIILGTTLSDEHGRGSSSVGGGLPDEFIGRCLKTRKPCPENNEPDYNNDKVCAVCLEDLAGQSDNSDHEKIIGVLDNCRHEFHVRCIKQWLRKKNACPLCRATALGR